MNGKKFDKLFTNAVENAKNKLVDILNKFFIENHNNDYEIVFNELYYSVTNGFCFPKRMYLNSNHRVAIERGFDWEDLTTDEEEICIDDMSLQDILEFCQFITENFESINKERRLNYDN